MYKSVCGGGEGKKARKEREKVYRSMLTFLPIILSHKLHLLFFSIHLLFSIMLTGFHTNIYIENNNLKVVTIRIFAFLSGCILALLKVYVVL